MITKGKIILAGGSGLLGNSLDSYFKEKGYRNVILTRSPEKKIGETLYKQWDGKTLGIWASELENAQAIINLTGRSVNCIHTPENQREIIESRVNSVRVLHEAIKNCKVPPKIWVQASSLAIYQDLTEQVLTEDSPHGSDFSTSVCETWEREFFEGSLEDIRKVVLRIGFALSPQGGALESLVWLVKRFLGGTVGSGNQYISWIHIKDLNEIFGFAVEHEEASGIYNATGICPTTNRDFMRILRKVLHRPWTPPTPEWLVKLGARFIMKTEPALALSGKRCVPKKLLDQNFSFKFTDLEEALTDLCKDPDVST